MTINWQELADGLEIEWRRLENVELVENSPLLWHSRDDLIEHARLREQPTRDVVDAAVRVFARGWHWPELSNDEKYFLKVRLNFAWHLAESFVPRKSRASRRKSALDPLPETALGMLEWLLIDLWPSLSFPIWMETQVQSYSSRANADLVANPIFCHPQMNTPPVFELRLPG